MKPRKKAALERRGWRVGSAAEFLELSAAESALIEVKIALGRTLRERRTAQGLTQAAVARRIHSSQSRVAKMEAADRSVSVDLLVRSLLALGATSRELGRALAKCA